ncbi:RNA polymerase sigma factor [Ruminococcus sp. XPD3002]|uniref:RNA polymerase sigma factor n=1 Tax=Ruminococcus sp. XPD3002 TaxID=1452269 RepID=UPI00091AB394|nr:sigma-70 family RNA polymerase sigma factor [Ruminococcus sp.]MBR6983218.1 sigma-70 family RNA polymerase sigma factor [Ruminococcus sp.]SFW97622.1 RNA polymerase sigma-70 factor, ECF subfamily [Ruminococcus flavefaciens]HPY83422.1 sigma-70 family RNA polymerase sigma factor [Ruminococcus flavefaciens]HRU96200.1 sigma-70 family RNA polymerase sigma factor [Ruminococcus sp.]
MTDNNSFSADVRLARKGDTAAFARLYSLVYKDMYHIALYSLRSSHDAADAVSDTVLDAFRSIGNLRDENAFRGWIMKILSAKIKQKQKEYFSNIEELSEDNSPAVSFDCESAELHEAMDKLDSTSRLILSLAVIQGYTSEEIASICSVKASTVRSRLVRIKEKLRLELQ